MTKCDRSALEVRREARCRDVVNQGSIVRVSLINDVDRKQ